MHRYGGWREINVGVRECLAAIVRHPNLIVYDICENILRKERKKITPVINQSAVIHKYHIHCNEQLQHDTQKSRLTWGTDFVRYLWKYTGWDGSKLINDILTQLGRCIQILYSMSVKKMRWDEANWVIWVLVFEIKPALSL